MSDSPQMRKVAVVLTMNDEGNRKKLAGIFDYLRGDGPQRRPRWDISLSETFVPPAADERGFDGLIIGAPLDPSTLSANLPLVGLHRPFAAHRPHTAFVACDNAAVARAAARHYRESGFVNFAYIHDRGLSPWSRERADSFVRALPAELPCRIWPDPANVEMSAWLRNLPQRTAIFAADDLTARETMLRCAALGIEIPRDLAFIGVDNDELLCESCKAPLSSIEPDFRRAGLLAAQQLDELMSAHDKTRRANAPNRLVLYGIRRIVERESSRLPRRTTDPRLQKALDFIRKNASRSITVRDVAAALHISRRSVELVFRNGLKTSVGKAIRLARLDGMMRKLKDSSLTITEICSTSGFASESHAKRAFKQRYGQTMSAFRR